MDLGERLAREVFTQFTNLHFGSNVRFDGGCPSTTQVLGFSFLFTGWGRKIDVLITPPMGEEAPFSRYFRQVISGEVFALPNFKTILENRDKSRDYVKRGRFYVDQKGYHYSGELEKQSPEKDSFVVMNHVIRPIVMYARMGK